MSALILNGSPKGRKSASFTLASKLAEGLRKNKARRPLSYRPYSQG